MENITQRTNYVRMWKYLAYLFWIIGLALGVYVATEVPYIHFSWMRTVPIAKMSIITFLIVQLVPVLFCIFCFTKDIYYFIPVISFLKSFLFSFSSFLIVLLYNYAGWLVHSLLFFTDSITSFAFLLYLSGGKAGSRNRGVSLIVFIIFVTLVDYFVICPFVGMLDI